MASNDFEQKPIIDEDAITELITRGVEEVYPSGDELAEALRSGRRLRAYMGIDPTAPDMHVGHESQLLKLRRLQDLGHHVILLIGDFTAMIGDPTDKSSARVKLTREEVLANAEGYLQQASKILDFDPDSPNPAELAYNSTWLGAMGFGDVLELASEVTVQQMLERLTFRKRIDDGKPVGLHEFLYPIMQGWDSVCLDVDIELGGSDQIFNMLVGSTFVRRHNNKQKFVIAGKLLVDPSGKKIGKTEGNMITLNDTPLDTFHKIMMWGDEITPHALELCSQMPMDQVRDIERRLKSGELSGIEGKMILAETIVTDLHGPEAAAEAKESYASLTQADREINREILTEFVVKPGQSMIDILCESGLTSSRRAARQLILDGAVRIDDKPVSMDWSAGQLTQESVLRVGKKKLENHRMLKPEPKTKN
jgi:tyrosyl-tRNA synthetase